MQPSILTVEVTANGSALRTRGLRSLGLREIRVAKPDAELDQAAVVMLQTLGEYVLSHEKPIRPDDKVSHGYWVLMLRNSPDGDLEVFESTADGSDYVEGANLALRYWVEQSNVCRQAGAEFSPPRPDQKVATSVGVVEGELPVWGVRYTAPPHMSGWYLTTQGYSGEIKDLRVDHLYHVTSRRPDIVPFLALPAGFRFEVTNQGSRAFLDEQALRDS